MSPELFTPTASVSVQSGPSTAPMSVAFPDGDHSTATKLSNGDALPGVVDGVGGAEALAKHRRLPRRRPQHRVLVAARVLGLSQRSARRR